MFLCMLFLVCGIAYSQSDTNLIQAHLKHLMKTPEYRTFQNTQQLNNTAKYIYDHFKKYADTAYFQNFTVRGETYRNVICRFESSSNQTIVIGAHYDVC